MFRNIYQGFRELSQREKERVLKDNQALMVERVELTLPKMNLDVDLFVCACVWVCLCVCARICIFKRVWGKKAWEREKKRKREKGRKIEMCRLGTHLYLSKWAFQFICEHVCLCVCEHVFVCVSMYLWVFVCVFEHVFLIAFVYVLCVETNKQTNTRWCMCDDVWEIWLRHSTHRKQTNDKCPLIAAKSCYLVVYC